MVGDLRDIVTQLRSLEPDPDTRIGSINGNLVPDLWFRGDTTATSFKTAQQLNDRVKWWSLPWLPMSQRPPDPKRALLPDNAGVISTHADLHLQNILVAGEPGIRRVSGLVDWGQAGWYPDYWEFCKAVLLTGDREFHADGWLVQDMPPFDEEYDAFVSYWQCNPS